MNGGNFVRTTPTNDAKLLIEILKIDVSRKVVVFANNPEMAIGCKIVYRFIEREAKMTLQELLPGLQDQPT